MATRQVTRFSAQHGARWTLTRTEACQLPGLSLSNFKRIEAANGFPFHRKQLAGAVRYRLTDIIDYINTDDAPSSCSATPDNALSDGE